MIRFYLKKEWAEKLLGADLGKQVSSLWGFSVTIDRASINSYIEIRDYLFDPIRPPISIPQEPIRVVTLAETIFQGFRSDGLYHLGNATLMARKSSEQAQDVHIAAPDLWELKDIYGLFRRGELAPDEDWGQKQKRNFFKRLFNK